MTLAFETALWIGCVVGGTMVFVLMMSAYVLVISEMGWRHDDDVDDDDDN